MNSHSFWGDDDPAGGELWLSAAPAREDLH